MIPIRIGGHRVYRQVPERPWWVIVHSQGYSLWHGLVRIDGQVAVTHLSGRFRPFHSRPDGIAAIEL